MRPKSLSTILLLSLPNGGVEKEPVAPFDFDFELYSLRTSEFKELIFEEI